MVQQPIPRQQLKQREITVGRCRKYRDFIGCRIPNSHLPKSRGKRGRGREADPHPLARNSTQLTHERGGGGGGGGGGRVRQPQQLGDIQLLLLLLQQQQ